MALMSINCPLSTKNFILSEEVEQQSQQFVFHEDQTRQISERSSATTTTTSNSSNSAITATTQQCYCCLLDRMDPFESCNCNGNATSAATTTNTVSCISNGGHSSINALQSTNMPVNTSGGHHRLKPQSTSSLSDESASSPGSSSTPDGFVSSESRLMRNLILLSLTSSLSLGIVHNLITIDRYIYGPWTYIGFAVCFMLSSLSVYYAQAIVTRFGPNQILTLSTATVALFVLVHYSSNFILFQMGAIVFALFVGPFYAAQLEFISSFIANLIHLTPTIKRYQEERYQRLLHLLLFSPSRIVGHLVYVILFIVYNRWSTTNNTIINNSSNIINTAIINNNNHQHTFLNHHSTSPQQQLESMHHHYNQNRTLNRVIFNAVHDSFGTSSWSPTSSSSLSSSVNPLCQRYFRQQYCDHQALYYMFSSLQRFHKTFLMNVVQPFEPSFLLLLTTVFIMISMIILLVVMFLLHRLEYYQIQDPLERSFLSNSIRNVMFRTFHDNHLRLLLPMAFFVGLEQGFFMSDYNKLYVSCALGLEAVGLIMLTRGFIHLVTTLLVHEFIRHIQRPLVLLAGSFCQLSVLVILYLWRPNDDFPLYYVITMCWALANAILETLLLTNVLKTFCADEWKYAFLTLYSMSYLGFGAAFAMSEFVCLYIKLNVLILVLIVALIPMNICELRLAKFEKILGPGSTSHI